MHEIRRNPHKSKLTNCFNDLVKSFMKMFKQSDQLDCHMTVYERSLFLVSTLFYQHVTESGKFKPWVLLRVTQTHEFWVMHVLIFRPLSMSNHTHTLTWITPWIEYVTFVSVVMSVWKSTRVLAICVLEAWAPISMWCINTDLQNDCFPLYCSVVDYGLA